MQLQHESICEDHEMVDSSKSLHEDETMKEAEKSMEDTTMNSPSGEIEEIPRLRKEISLEIIKPKSVGLPASSGWFAGNGTFGQLGAGTNADSKFPVPLTMQGSHFYMSVSRIAVGSCHSIAVSPEGSAFCFGLNDSGQCAIRSSSADVVLSPLQTSMENDVYIRSTKIVDVACGGQHTAVITADGELVTWGNSEHGQCGHDNTKNLFSPRLVRALSGQYVSQVACGDSHTLILTNTSLVLSCGLAMHHALGHGTEEDVATPTPIRALWSLPVIQIGAGEHHSAALLSTGVVYLWGRNNQGQIGKSTQTFDEAQLAGINQQMLSMLLEMGYSQAQSEEALIQTKNSGVDACVEWLHVHSNENSDQNSVQKVPGRCAGLSGVKSIACGANHNVAVTSKAVYSWGAGGCGQLGHGGRGDELAPREITALTNKGVCEASCGYSHTLFRTDEGRLLACGSNEFGQLLIGEAWTESLGVVDVSAALQESMRNTLPYSPTRPSGASGRLPPHLQVRSLAAGGQTSAVTVGLTPFSPPVSRMQQFALLGQSAITKLHKLIQGTNSGSTDEADQLKEQTRRLFRSSAALTAVCSNESGDGIRFQALEELYTALLPALGSSGTACLVEALNFLLNDMIDHLSSPRPGTTVTTLQGTTSCARAALAVAQIPVMPETCAMLASASGFLRSALGLLSRGLC
mmetsp:Transcript_29441/g.70774  ORF Transcript_29441/g.70774 Transcript_29441/m.70774 type:complete len:689 (+) Transcript_29441:65-2131(+)